MVVASFLIGYFTVSVKVCWKTGCQTGGSGVAEAKATRAILTTNFIYKRIEIALSHITDLILVSGVRVKNELLEAGIGNERQYVSVKPGIEPVELLKKSDARDKLQLSQDVTVVGWLGRISQIKRPDRVIELAREIPQLTFLVGARILLGLRPL